MNPCFESAFSILFSRFISKYSLQKSFAWFTLSIKKKKKKKVLLEDNFRISANKAALFPLHRFFFFFFFFTRKLWGVCTCTCRHHKQETSQFIMTENNSHAIASALSMVLKQLHVLFTSWTDLFPTELINSRVYWHNEDDFPETSLCVVRLAQKLQLHSNLKCSMTPAKTGRTWIGKHSFPASWGPDYSTKMLVLKKRAHVFVSRPHRKTQGFFSDSAICSPEMEKTYNNNNTRSWVVFVAECKWSLGLVCTQRFCAIRNGLRRSQFRVKLNTWTQARVPWTKHLCNYHRQTQSLSFGKKSSDQTPPLQFVTKSSLCILAKLDKLHRKPKWDAESLSTKDL